MGKFVAAILMLVTVGSVVFHFVSPWWWTEIASNWGYIDNAILITFWITGFVFVAVLGFMAYCVLRFRNQPGRKAAYEPENKKLEWWLTGITGVGIVAMLTPGLFVWGQYVTVPDEATEIEVLAQQWQWAYRLPGEDGLLGTTDVKNIDFDNPFGITPDDPNGRDDVLIESNELHIPLDRPVKVLLRSIDVLHNFYIPQFRAKMDMVPGTVTFYWFTPTRTGDFDVLCFELCGVNHYLMRGNVVVNTQADYDAWLAEQITYEQYASQYDGGAEDAADRVDLALDGEIADPIAPIGVQSSQ